MADTHQYADVIPGAETAHVDDPGFSVFTEDDLIHLRYIWGRDGAAFCETALSIVSEDEGRVIPFVPTQEQRLMLKVIDTLRLIGVPVRMVIDKPRQIYATTVINADGFRQEFLSPDPFFRVVMADVYAKTENLFRANELFIKNMDDDFRPRVMPNRSGLKLIYPDTDAHLGSYSAESSNVGRSGTIHYLHLSECAFYPRFREMAEGLLNCVPDKPGSTIIWETTANGFDTGFHPRWVTAIEHARHVVRTWNALHPDKRVRNLVDYRGHELPDTAHIELILKHKWWDGSYVPLFFTWTGMQKYRREPALEQLTWQNLTEYEHAIADAHGLDLWQLAWRRYKIRETLGGRPVYTDDDEACVSFQQEYPLTWQQSFVTKAGSYFNRSIVTTQMARSEALARRAEKSNGKLVRTIKPAVIGWVQGHAPRFNVRGHLENREELMALAKGTVDSDLLIYKAPLTPKSKPKASLYNYRYVIGADISEGLAQGDNSVAAVFDRVKHEYVAEFCGKIRPLAFAELLAKLSYYYDNAYVMGEFNDQGPSVVPRFLEFTTRAMPRPEVGKGIDLNVIPGAYWFQTTASRVMGKEWAVKLLDNYVNAFPIGIPFSGFWKEASTFVRHPKTNALGADGKTKGQDSSKNYDDRIMGYAMALVGDHYLPAAQKTRKPQAIVEYEKKARSARHEDAVGISPIDDLPHGVRVL